MPATLEKQSRGSYCAAEITDRPVDRDELLSNLQTLYDELDRKLCIT